MPCIFFVGSVVIFFILPLGILICVYILIARTLMTHPTQLVSFTFTNFPYQTCVKIFWWGNLVFQANLQSKNITIPTQSVIKYRKQVMLMLGAVVMAFFICLLPFRALTLWIIISPPGSNFTIGIYTPTLWHSVYNVSSRFWNLLQHPVLFENNVSHQLSNQSDFVQFDELQVPGWFYQAVRFEEAEKTL